MTLTWKILLLLPPIYIKLFESILSTVIIIQSHNTES